MLPALRLHPRSVAVAAADLNRRAREQFTRDYEAPAYDDAAALCINPDVDVVYVATPHQFHAEHCLLAAAHGKHILVEKPLALSLSDCDAIIEAAAQAKVQLIIGHTASYHPGVLEMRRIIASGALGPLRLVNINAYTPFLYRPRRTEELDTAQGGGIIFNQVPHQVDTARVLAGGLARSVRATAGVWDAERPTEGGYTALLEFEDGAAASLTYSGYDHYDTQEFAVSVDDDRPLPIDSHGNTRRALETARKQAEEPALLADMGYGGPRMRGPGPLTGGLFQAELGLLVASCERGDLRLATDGLIVYDDAGKRTVPVRYPYGIPGRGNVVDEVYRAVVGGTPPAHHGRWGRATLEVCHAILQSSRERREITLAQQCSWDG